jgi:transposase
MIYLTKGAPMEEIIEALDENLSYLGHEMFDDYIAVWMASNREEISCPFCGKMASKVHSIYERSFQDLPIQGKKVYVNIANRKYFCDNPNCSHTTFAESFACLRPKAKKASD